VNLLKRRRDKKIIRLANKLLKAITKQGYCVKTKKDFGTINIWLHDIGTKNYLEVENIRNGWSVHGELTAPLVQEEEAE
jgi:hypothetical protein